MRVGAAGGLEDEQDYADQVMPADAALRRSPGQSRVTESEVGIIARSA